MYTMNRVVARRLVNMETRPPPLPLDRNRRPPTNQPTTDVIHPPTLLQRSYVTGSIDHRGERYRHKKVIDALNVQTRQVRG